MFDRCTGHCCRRISLPVSPEELQDAKESFLDLNRTAAFMRTSRLPKADFAINYGPDILTIADTMIFVEKSRIWEDGEEHDYEKHFYTCKHLVDGDCAIYETRPKMCRNYPYEGRCMMQGCTWKAGREGTHRQKGIDMDCIAKSDLAQGPDDIVRLSCRKTSSIKLEPLMKTLDAYNALAEALQDMVRQATEEAEAVIHDNGWAKSSSCSRGRVFNSVNMETLYLGWTRGKVTLTFDTALEVLRWAAAGCPENGDIR